MRDLIRNTSILSLILSGSLCKTDRSSPVASCVFPELLGYLSSRSVGASHFSQGPPGTLDRAPARRSRAARIFAPISSVTHNSKMSVVLPRGEEWRNLAAFLRCRSVTFPVDRDVKPSHTGRQLSDGWSSRIITTTPLKAQTVWVFGCAEWCNLHIWSRFLRLNTHWIISDISPRAELPLSHQFHRPVQSTAVEQQ